MSSSGSPKYQQSSTGRMPNDWTATTLGKVADLRGGSAFKETFQGNKVGEFPFIKVSDFNLPLNHRFIREANNWIDAEANKDLKATLFDKGAVVFAKVGAALLLNRRRVLTRKTAIDNNLMAATPRAIDPTFLYYQLQAVDFGKLVQEGAVPSVNQGQLQALPLAKPPYAEQRKIAAILTAVDDKLDVIARQIKATQTLKQGLMQTLFSQGSGAQDADGRWFRHSDFKDSVLGTIPTSWGALPIGELFEVVERSVQMSDEQRYRRVTVKRRYGGVELRDELRGCEIKVKSQFALKEGDFLISERQIVHGACGIVPRALAGALVSNEYLVLRAADRVDVRYFNYLVQQLKYAKYFFLCSQGVDIEKFLFKPRDWLKKMVPVPPVSEQTRIADVLSTVDSKLDVLRHKQVELQQMKRGLMQKLLTGEWRVKVDAEMAA